MKIRRQHYRLYPELALFESDAERIAALKAFQKAIWRNRNFWLMSVLYGMINAVGIAGGTWLMTRLAYFSTVPRPIMTSIPAMVLGTLFGLSFQFIWRRPIQRALREHLVAKGVPICLHCGYDMRGLPEPRCPECGECATPQVRSPNRV
jgi:hypothetical protein